MLLVGWILLPWALAASKTRLSKYQGDPVKLEKLLNLTDCYEQDAKNVDELLSIDELIRMFYRNRDRLAGDHAEQLGSLLAEMEPSKFDFLCNYISTTFNSENAIWLEKVLGRMIAGYSNPESVWKRSCQFDISLGDDELDRVAKSFSWGSGCLTAFLETGSFQAHRNFYFTAAQVSPSWFTNNFEKTPLSFQLAFAWKYPSYAQFVGLPKEMPELTELISPLKPVSNDKAPLIKHLVQAYPILPQAMAQSGWYTEEAVAQVSAMAAEE